VAVVVVDVSSLVVGLTDQCQVITQSKLIAGNELATADDTVETFQVEYV